ncbi:hypothetical protein FH972_017380 [Carpinus fangiana]|uniref:Uncharacterized protein n=1 Tax=Carpinus fangiana TaxID=176857 RepID=A0A5N6RKV2_9ROSI|nr:hypothetical protein FH972_017380 [Carpinus fangiana]
MDVQVTKASVEKVGQLEDAPLKAINLVPWMDDELAQACVHGVLGGEWDVRNVGENRGLDGECSHVVSHTWVGAGGLEVRCGAEVVHLNADERQSRARVAHVQAGVGEMEVEQQGGVGRKSLR